MIYRDATHLLRAVQDGKGTRSERLWEWVLSGRQAARLLDLLVFAQYQRFGYGIKGFPFGQIT